MSAPAMASRSFPLTVGDKGRLVIPAELRHAHGWTTGSALIAVDSPAGVLLVTVEEAMKQIREASTRGVDDFLAMRRADASIESAEHSAWGA